MPESKRRSRPRPKPAPAELTEGEWAIMKVVWEHEPCAAGTVQEALQHSRGWAYSTVKTTMDRMAVKGLLATRSVRNLNLFTSNISPAQAKRGEIRRMLKRAFDGTLTPMMQFLLEDNDLSAEELDELRKLLTKAKRKKS